MSERVCTGDEVKTMIWACMGDMGIIFRTFWGAKVRESNL